MSVITSYEIKQALILELIILSSEQFVASGRLQRAKEAVLGHFFQIWQLSGVDSSAQS